MSEIENRKDECEKSVECGLNDDNKNAVECQPDDKIAVACEFVDDNENSVECGLNDDNKNAVECQIDDNKNAVKCKSDNTKGKSNHKYIVIAVAIVVLCIAIFSNVLPIYLRGIAGNRDLYKNKEIMFISDGKEVGVFTLEQLLEIVTPVEFAAVYKPSGKSPVTNTYLGLRLKDVLSALEISLEGKTGVIFGCRDGSRNKNIEYVTTKRTFISYMVNGKNIPEDSATGEEGGKFVIISADDEFSQDRVKWLVSIEII